LVFFRWRDLRICWGLYCQSSVAPYTFELTLAVLAVAYGRVMPPRAVRASEYFSHPPSFDAPSLFALLALAHLRNLESLPSGQGVFFTPCCLGSRTSGSQANVHAGVHPQTAPFATWQGPDKPFFMPNEGNLSHTHTHTHTHKQSSFLTNEQLKVGRIQPYGIHTPRGL